MTDNPEFAQVDDNTQPGVLRQKLEQALAVLKQKDQEIAALKTAETQRTVESTWNELKVPDAIRKLYNGDTSADAIKAWWEDSKGLFNIQAADEAPAVQQPPSSERLAAIQAAQQFQQASTLGTDALNSGFDAATAASEKAKAILRTKGRGADYEAARQEMYTALNTKAF